MRFLIVAVWLALLPYSPVWAQGARQKAVDSAMSNAERVCLSGNRFQFKLNAGGDLRIIKLVPGANTTVDVDKHETRGGTFFQDSKVRDLVDDKIRACMERQWPQVIKFLADEKEFSALGPQVNFGCEQGNTSSVTFAAPPGWKIINAFVATPDTDGTKYATPKIDSQEVNKVIASAYFHGRDRDWVRNCPGGGHGQIRVYGTMMQE